MNYLQELNAFRDWTLLNKPTTSEIVLWYALMSINNMTGWKKQFTVANQTLQLMTGLSKATLDRARNKLTQKGLLKYTPGNTRQAGTYELVSISATKRDQCETNSETNMRLMRDQCETNGENIIKYKQNKTKLEYNTPLNPPKKNPDQKLYDEFFEQNVEADKVTVASDEQPGENSGPRPPFKSKRQEQLFDEFWAQYPKKRNKGQAERAWAKIKPDEQLFKAILDGLERAKKSRDWLKNEGQFIPYPATWLNAKGWEDVHNDLMRREEEATFDWGYGYKPD